MVLQVIDRGSRGINFVLTAMVFNIVPTLFELTLVSTILVSCYNHNLKKNVIVILLLFRD